MKLRLDWKAGVSPQTAKPRCDPVPIACACQGLLELSSVQKEQIIGFPARLAPALVQSGRVRRFQSRRGRVSWRVGGKEARPHTRPGPTDSANLRFPAAEGRSENKTASRET